MQLEDPRGQVRHFSDDSNPDLRANQREESPSRTGNAGGSDDGACVSGAELADEDAREATGNGRARLDAAGAAAGRRRGCASCLSSLMVNLPGGSCLALGLMCGGVILIITGFFLTRQELASYVKQHQQVHAGVNFDEMFPNLLYWIIGLSAGLLFYSVLHCIINVLLSIRGSCYAKNPKASRTIGSCWKTCVFITVLADTLFIAGTGLMACAAFLPVYGQAMFAARLSNGQAQFDLGHYVANHAAPAGRLVVEGDASTDGSVVASSFPMFYPSLALFIGVCLTETSLIMSLIFLASNYAQLQVASLRQRSARKSSAMEAKFSTKQSGLSLDTQL